MSGRVEALLILNGDLFYIETLLILFRLCEDLNLSTILKVEVAI